MPQPVPDPNSDLDLTNEKLINILETERRTYTDELVPLHPTKLSLIQKSVALTIQNRDSIKRNVPKKRAHIILNDLWTSIPEAFVLSTAAILPYKLGSLKSTTYLRNILEWWKGVEHPKALTLTVHRLDILKALPERKNPGPQDTLGGFIGSLGSPTSILGSSNTTLPAREKVPIPHDQLVSQAASSCPPGTTPRIKEDGSTSQGVQQLAEAGQQFWEGSGTNDPRSSKRRCVSQNDLMESGNLYSNDAQTVATPDMLWMGLDGIAVSTQPDFPDPMPCPLNQVFTFLSHYFEKCEGTFHSNTATPYIDIKGPFGQVSTRMFLDWDTSNELVKCVKMGAL